MQAVFAVAAVTLFVPVLYHRQRNEEVSGLDANAPGEECHLLPANVPRTLVPSLCPCTSHPWNPVEVASHPANMIFCVPRVLGRLHWATSLR